jgi:hypothetical protein
MADNVPATALSRYRQTFQPSGLGIGTNNFYPTLTSADTPAYWFIVVDLTSLKVVVNVISTDPTAVPSEVSPYLGNTQFFLYFVANAQIAQNMPQGPLYTFLQQVGSGPVLTNLEQTIEQMGTGTILSFSYILAATMDTNDNVGFESVDLVNYTTLAMQFMPVQVGGQTIYAPIRIE